MKTIQRGVVAVICLVVMSGCAHQNLPRIYNTDSWIENPVQVSARYKGCVSEKVKERTFKYYAFTVIEPHKYKDKKILLTIFWSELKPSQFIQDKIYLVTTPRDEIGSGRPICGMGYKFEDERNGTANQSLNATGNSAR